MRLKLAKLPLEKLRKYGRYGLWVSMVTYVKCQQTLAPPFSLTRIFNLSSLISLIVFIDVPL